MVESGKFERLGGSGRQWGKYSPAQWRNNEKSTQLYGLVVCAQPDCYNTPAYPGDLHRVAVDWLKCLAFRSLSFQPKQRRGNR